MKHTNKLVISFFLFFLLIFSVFFCLIPVSAKITIVDNTAGRYSTRQLDTPINGVRSFVKTSTDRYVAMYINATYLVFSYSDDLGSTWTEILISTNAWNKIYSYDMCIDGYDNIWLTTLNTSGGYTTSVFKYSSSGVLLYSYTLATGDNVAQNDVLAITCDKDNNIYVAVYRYLPFGASRTYLYRYDYVLQTWSEKSGVPRSYCFAMDTDSDGNVYIFGNGAVTMIWSKYTVSTDTVTTGTIALPTINYQYSMDLAIYNDILYCTYVKSIGGSLAIYLLHGSSPSSMVDDLVYYSAGYSYTSPTVSVSLDGTLHTVFSGSTPLSANTQILNIDNVSGSATTLKYYTGGNYNKDCAKLLYQNYPLDIKLLSGFACMYRNVSGLNYLDSSDIAYQTSGGLPDFTSYNTIGSFPEVVSWITITTKCVKFRYDLPFTGSITGMDFFVASTTGTPSDYWLSINGNSKIQASYIGTYDLDTSGSYLYFIRWDFRNSPVGISNADAVLMEFYTEHKPPSPFDTGYWFPSKATTTYYNNGDVDGDGEQTYKTNIGLPSGLYTGDSHAGDLVYLMYYSGTGSIPVSPSTAYNTLNVYGLSGNNMLNATSGHLLFYRNASIGIEYSVADPLLSSYIRLYPYGSGTQIITQLFPFLISPEKDKGTIGFSSVTVGNYNISLLINGLFIINRSIDIIVNPDTSDTLSEIYTTPPITENYQPYDVTYNYYSTNYTGYLMVFSTASGTPTSFGSLKEFASYLINPNSHGIIHFTHTQKESNHYWKIYAYLNGAYYQRGSMHMHLINNQVTTSLNVELRPGYTGVLAVASIRYTHNLVGSGVYLFINNVSWRNIGSLGTNIEDYAVAKAGNYQVDMYLKENNGSLVKLCTGVKFTVIGEIVDVPANDIDSLLSDIPDLIKIILAIVIISVLTLIPAFVSMMASSRVEITIPSLVYVAFFVLGVVATILLGLLEVWSIFFVIFVLVLVLAIFWVKGQKE